MLIVSLVFIFVFRYLSGGRGKLEFGAWTDWWLVVQLSQQFVYKGVNVLVNGSAPLNMYGNSDACKYSTSGGGTCTQKQVTVKVSSATVMTKKN